MNKDRVEPCYSCVGQGFVQHMEVDILPGVNGHPVRHCRTFTMTCKRCNGVGSTYREFADA